MTGSAIILILIAAFGHATWNYLAKKACGGTAFIWLFATLSTLLYFPLASWIIVVQNPIIGWYQLGFMLGSAILHSLYYILLDKGYRIGDLSLIYPLARGTGPMLSTIAAIAFLDEQPSAVALGGTYRPQTNDICYSLRHYDCWIYALRQIGCQHLPDTTFTS